MRGQLIVVFLVGFAYAIQAFDKGNFKYKLIIQVIWNNYYLDDLLVVAVVPNETDGYHRFIRSLNIYGFKYEVFTREVFFWLSIILEWFIN